MSILRNLLASVFKPAPVERERLDVPEPRPPMICGYDFEGVRVKLVAANPMIAWRAESFYKKEPDTVAWLRRMPRQSIFLDIGANIGIYALAAAMGRNCRVYAFEPESQNYANLNANIFINNLSNQVLAYCAALTDKPGLDRLFLSRFDQSGGGSCHSYGEEVGFDLLERQSPFAQGCVGLRLDDLVQQGIISVPDYIKIDVDGFEHRVIAGGLDTLRNPKVKEILIEINPDLEQHKKLIKTLKSLGFYYEMDQRFRAARKSGVFKGVGEIIFRRIERDQLKVRVGKLNFGSVLDTEPSASDTELVDFVLNRIRQTTLEEEPFPYLVIDDFFPENYYQEILQHFPDDSQMIPLSETGRSNYKDRLVTLFNQDHFSRLHENDRKFWQEFAGWLYSDKFINSTIDKFLPHVACRLADLGGDGDIKLQGDALIVSDKSNYSIGPHTDAPHRLITFLFYLGSLPFCVERFLRGDGPCQGIGG